MNSELLKRFIHDLGTLKFSEDETAYYFRRLGEEPQEYIEALHTMPSFHLVNGKVWCDQR